MNDYALLISPEARGAYFADFLDVAEAELRQVAGELPLEPVSTGGLHFLYTRCESARLPLLLRLSFVQGIFSRAGDSLTPLPVHSGLQFHEDLVFGAKYRGKTNERLTQLLLNVGLSALGVDSGEGLKLLDPMCGRGTSLFWALRYGLVARGIEQDPRALEEVRRQLKKYCKLHRQKHQLREGSLGKARRDKAGRFLEFSSAGSRLRMLAGDARNATELLQGEKFDLLLSDLPYGVQHHTTAGTRNPLAVLADCAGPWRASLRSGGALVLAFNRYQPRRAELARVFTAAGFRPAAFSAPHRMSESIVRDVLLMTAE